MTALTPRRLIAAGAALALALPGAALAHGRSHHESHARHFHARGVPCHALEKGRTPARFTADQASALKDACTTRDAAIKAANATFRSDTADARSAYKDAVAPLRADLKSAAQARRTACHADRTSQDCADARSAYRNTLETDLPKLREAFRTYIQAIRPALKTRNQSIRDAQRAFRAAVQAALA